MYSWIGSIVLGGLHVTGRMLGNVNPKVLYSRDRFASKVTGGT